MAKMKTFAVEVEIPVKITLFVDARKPNGAVERLFTDEGWRQAWRYEAPAYDDVLSGRRKDAKVLGIREV